MRNVVFIAPFPLDATMRFARAAATLPNVRLHGIMQEAPPGGVFADLVTVADGLDAGQLTRAAELLVERHGPIHRVLGILEPLQVQLGEVRRALGILGTSPETAEIFRDKARMKEQLRRHGLPCARHRLIRTWDDAESFVGEVGLPIVLKPLAGMGCKATWRIRSIEDLRSALAAVLQTPDQTVLAEEFLQGQEYSLETITVGGEVRFRSISQYYPGPLEVIETPWIKWVVIVPRDLDGAEFAEAHELGTRAVTALGLEMGFTHMEWFRRPDGSLAIGEIAARPPGAHFIAMHGYAHDTDMYRAWARAVVDDAFDGPFERRYAVGCAYLRGAGQGRVLRVTGVDRANDLVGKYVVESRLPPVGSPRSSSYEGDGHVIVRHADTEVVKAAMKTIIETIQVHYG